MLKRIMVSFKRDREAWMIGDQIYLAPINTNTDANGHPMASRWECSVAHWDNYRDTVFSDFAPIVSTDYRDYELGCHECGGLDGQHLDPCAPPAPFIEETT
jgi:hypothetical protein